MKFIIALVASLAVLSAGATSLLLVSPAGFALPPSVTAGGDSSLPIISADERYVLFASSADNLALGTNNLPYQVSLGACLNVYLRDRTNNTLVLVSVSGSGTAVADQASLPDGLSTNGQFALFESTADNLGTVNSNNVHNVYVRDLVNGTNILVSVNTNGVCPNGDSTSPAMTPDGRYVVFSSVATDLVTGDANGIADVFVRDLQAGTTRLVSVGAMSTGSATLPSVSDAPAITPDGRYVAFYSSATNLVSKGTNAGDVYVRDLTGGTTIWASTAARGLYQSVAGAAAVVSCNLSISANDGYVAFETCINPTTSSDAQGIILRYGLGTGLTDLVYTNAFVAPGFYQDLSTLSLTPDGRFISFVANVGGNSGANTAIYLWDAQSGTNTLVSANTNSVLSASSYCNGPVVSTNGQYVAFVSSASDLITNPPAASGYDVYVRNVPAGTTTLVDATTNGFPAGVEFNTVPGLSADGQSVVFETVQGNLVPNDYNHDYDVFIRNLGSATTELVSASLPVLPCLAANGFSESSAEPLSADGRYLTFASVADNLVPGDTNQIEGVFVDDLYAGSNTLVSLGYQGAGASDISYEPAISGNGRYVAFTSAATNLIATDTNNSLDVFVRDLQGQTNYLVSANISGKGEGNSNSFMPAISFDGRYVLFVSAANNLAAGTFSGGNNLFLRDRQLGTNYALTTDGYVAAAMNSPGTYVAFSDTAGSTAGKLYLWESQLAKVVATNIQASGVQTVAVSPDGSTIAYFNGTSPVDLWTWNQVSNRVTSLVSATPRTHPGLRFSANSRFLTYASSTASSTTNQVYLFDLLLQTNILVSHAAGLTVAANGSSDSPDISANGRYVVYRSGSVNLVAGDTNGVPDIFLYDATTGTNIILSPGAWGNVAANNRSLLPVFSASGEMLVFGSWASDLTAGDFSQSGSLFAFEFLYASVAATNAGAPTISWPAITGKNYSVQFMNNLTDAAWQPATGPVSIIGNRAYLTDTTATSGQRFYRVVSGN